MNIRKWMYFSVVSFRGQPLGNYYQKFLHEYQNGIPIGTSEELLIKLLEHCEKKVPYYSKTIKQLGSSYREDPIQYLKNFPVLTKDIIRSHFNELKSDDLGRRKWYRNSSGGSTGTPVILLQDWSYAAHSGAIKLLFSKLVGKETGEREIRLWGNIHDITSNTESWRAQFVNWLENATFINSQLMTSDQMREYIDFINKSNARLIVAYSNAIFEIARFAEREGIRVHPQTAIITSAFKLYPHMREKIEQVFECKVFDRYGSREVGDIACENREMEGLWVAPWGNYLEIVDSEGNRLPDGTEGEILVTSLTNYAMPLIRYQILDRGVLSPSIASNHHQGQILKEVTGRSMDLFRTRNGAKINPGYFMANLYFRDWISRYQVIQKDFTKVEYKIVKVTDPPETELKEITRITKDAMGDDCEVCFEFVDEISASPSGKFRFLISEIADND